MGAGMLPIALGRGSDPSFRAPMAIVVIGGLISSTFLSLLVIPVFVTCVDDLVQWLRRRMATRMSNGAHELQPPAAAAPWRNQVASCLNMTKASTNPRHR